MGPLLSFFALALNFSITLFWVENKELELINLLWIKNKYAILHTCEHIDLKIIRAWLALLLGVVLIDEAVSELANGVY